MRQQEEMSSPKETHSFSAVFYCSNFTLDGGSVVLFKPVIEPDADDSRSFWKLEHFVQAVDMPGIGDNKMEALGRITKVSIDENSCTKVATSWRATKLALSGHYKRLYVNYIEGSIVGTDPYELPMEHSRKLVGVAFTLRYNENDLEDAPLQLNISVDGSELPGASHVDLEINLRTGNKVVSEDVDGQIEKQLGGMAVLIQNPAQIQFREIDEAFTKYLLQKFGSGRLKEVFYLNKSHGSQFCSMKKINGPFKQSWCLRCILI